MSMNVLVLPVDFSQESHRQALLDLLDMYARDPMGGGKPLPDDVRQRLLPSLQAQAGGRYFLAFIDNQPVGIAICFPGFSTFRARSLLNIHDIAVRPEHRGQGVGRALLTAVEQEARRLGCCKLTLEVRADNVAGRQAYLNFGFDPGDANTSAMAFWTKDLKMKPSRWPSVSEATGKGDGPNAT